MVMVWSILLCCSNILKSTDVSIIVVQCIVALWPAPTVLGVHIHNGGHSRHYWTGVWTKMQKDNKPNKNLILNLFICSKPKTDSVR